MPDLDLKLSALTTKDREDLKFFLKQKEFAPDHSPYKTNTASAFQVDYIAMSFVQTASDIDDLVSAMEECGVPVEAQPKIIPKIEKPQAVVNIDAILAKSAGIMIARGVPGAIAGVE